MQSPFNCSDQALTKLITTRVILIRHGRSSFNDLKLYQGSSDTSILTEQGYQSAHQVGQFLKAESIDAIYVSPLKRVQQTTDALLKSVNFSSPKQLEIHPSLREIEMGSWEGRSFQEIQQTEVQAYSCWKQRPHEFMLEMPQAFGAITAKTTATVALPTYCYPVLDLYDRVRHFWQEILPRHQSQTVAIVSHGGTNRALISTAIGLPPARFHSLQQSNCGINILQFSEGCLKGGYLKTLNLTTPIGEILPKLKEGKQGLRLLLLPAESTSRSAISLSELLRNITIEFSLSITSPVAHSLTQEILRFHPQTIQLQSQQDSFLHHWQQTIATKSSHSSQLMTGLVIAQSTDIQKLLGNAIGLPPTDHWRLQVQPGALSILHYPAANCLPVVQAINFSSK